MSFFIAAENFQVQHYRKPVKLISDSSKAKEFNILTSAKGN